ncbi:MAG: transporter, family, hexuronate transporter [Clostridia bacterium]|nr:transporter, family, hexuronate transporter [Clostridia bacterium]
MPKISTQPVTCRQIAARVQGVPWLFLALFSLAHAANAMSYNGLAPIASFVQNELQLTKAQLGTITGAFSLGIFAASIPTGWLVDRLGARQMLFWGQVAVAVFTAVFAFSFNFWPILLANTLAGAGYACLNPATNKAVLCCFPKNVRATAMGTKQMGVALGTAAAAAILPALALTFSWRVGLLAVAALVSTTALMSFIFYRIEEEKSQASFLKSLSLKEIFRNNKLLLLGVMGMAFTGAQVCFTTYAVIFLQEALALPPVEAGSYLSLALICAAIARISWGVISDRFFGGRRRPVLLLLALLAAAMAAVLSVLPPGMPSWILAPVVAIMGMTAVGWNGLQMTLVSEAAGRQKTGFATGFTLAIGYLGSIFGPPLFGYLVDLTGQYRISWLMLTGIMLAIALVLAIFKMEEHMGIPRGLDTP